MYSEITLTRHSILVNGRAYTSNAEAVADLRAFLGKPPAGWAGPAIRKSFRTWVGPEGTRIRLTSFPVSR